MISSMEYITVELKETERRGSDYQRLGVRTGETSVKGYKISVKQEKLKASIVQPGGYN